MARVEATAGSEAPEIEDGLYPVTVTAVEQTTMEADKFGHPEKLRFTLALEGVVNENGETVTLDPLINEKLSMPDAKMISTLTKWAAVFGVPIVHGGIDTEDFIGKRAQALIQTANPGDWPRVKDLLPAKKGSAPPATNGVAAANAFLKVEASGDPIVDWTLFWAIARKHGINKEGIIAEAGKEQIEDIDPFDLPVILEALIAKVTA